MSISFTAVAAARSADLRLQVWAPGSQGLLTRWKGSAAASAGWTPWQPSSLPTDAEDQQLVPSYLFAGQLLSESKSPNAGRMQLWAVDNGALVTTVKSSEQVSAAWGPWIPFTGPPPLEPNSPYQIVEGAVAPLLDGRLQVFVFLSGGPMFGIWSTVQTGAQWNAAWSPWQQFSFPGLTGSDFTVCQLPDGRTQLWAIGPGPDGVTPAVWTTIREGTPGDLSNPLFGWGPWSLFEVPAAGNVPPATVSPVQALRAMQDGQGRTYLWINNAGGNPAKNVNNWVYTYTQPFFAPGPPVTWTPLAEFPTPPSGELYASNAVMSAAVLPAGVLQIFFLNYVGPQHGIGAAYPPHIWTSWQEAGQLPTAWTVWSDFTS